MKVIHILKKIEDIDQDIKELRKLEKTVQTNKSFTTPIFMSIERQINILLGERIKLLELKIENPPDTMVLQIEGDQPVETPLLAPAKPAGKAVKAKPKKGKSPIKKNLEAEEIRMLTQDDIDSRFSKIQKQSDKEKEKKKETAEAKNDDSVKLLDIALEKGSLAEKDETKEKKVRFFRDNFPLD